MKLLISGICGFVGSTLARALRESLPGVDVAGFDNFARPGSELNRLALKRCGISVQHLDARSATDMAALPDADWVLDAAAMPSVLAGIDGRSSSRQLLEHNLGSTINLLEYCKARSAGFILLSTSRVYSIGPLAALPIRSVSNAFAPEPAAALPAGISTRGITEDFSTQPPVSLYGSTKIASELLALEYGAAFDFPVWINRCGVMAGAGQFGQAEQGIFSFWINSWLRGAPLKYIGFGGTGHQVRDCLHPRDLVPLLRQQFDAPSTPVPRLVNVAGGVENSLSLAQVSDWCAARFGPREVASVPAPRPFDLPWVVLDPALAARTWQWQPQTSITTVLEEIARHAEDHPEWLDVSRP
jgi:CDP-paratose 2-epimerase